MNSAMNNMLIIHAGETNHLLGFLADTFINELMMAGCALKKEKMVAMWKAGNEGRVEAFKKQASQTCYDRKLMSHLMTLYASSFVDDLIQAGCTMKKTEIMKMWVLPKVK